jgi:DNA-binding HxlR family transcriptional regulator
MTAETTSSGWTNPTVRLVGERWTLPILREALAGARRWVEFKCRLDISTSVLSERLDRLTAAGIFQRVLYQDRPPRCEYRLTAAGQALLPVTVALMSWGETHGALNDHHLEHVDCGSQVEQQLTCEVCGSELSLESLIVRPTTEPGGRDRRLTTKVGDPS